MTTSYPTGLDSYTNPTATDELDDEIGTRTHSEFHADLNDAMEAVQAELGTEPSGASATVKARIEAVETLADAAQTAAEVATAISTHEADTTSVHGITDTSTLYRAGGTDVAIADGGTGASDAATGFANLKQAASETATGVVELATNAETITGTDTARAVTPANITALVADTSFLEKVSDQVGTMVTGNTESNITVTYQDADNTLDFDVPAGTDTTAGVLELATAAEVLTGTDTARAATAAGISAAYLKKTLVPGSVADDSWDGPTATLTAAENLVIGDVCYINSSSKMAKGDADAAGTAGVMAIALGSISADASGTFGLPGGYLRDDSAYNWTPGAALYLSVTAGGITATAPSGTGDVVQVLGYAHSADVVFFNPSPILIVEA